MWSFVEKRNKETTGFKFDSPNPSAEIVSMSDLSKQYDFSSITNQAVANQLDSGGFKFTTDGAASNNTTTFAGFNFSTEPAEPENEPRQVACPPKNPFQFGVLQLKSEAVEGEKRPSNRKDFPSDMNIAALFCTNELASWAFLGTASSPSKRKYIILSRDCLYYFKTDYDQQQPPQGIIRFYPTTTVTLNSAAETIRISSKHYSASLKLSQPYLDSTMMSRALDLGKWLRLFHGAITCATEVWHEQVWAKFVVFLAMNDESSCAFNDLPELRHLIFTILLSLDFY
jgi:hypothetical protein